MGAFVKKVPREICQISGGFIIEPPVDGFLHDRPEEMSNSIIPSSALSLLANQFTRRLEIAYEFAGAIKERTLQWKKRCCDTLWIILAGRSGKMAVLSPSIHI